MATVARDRLGKTLRGEAQTAFSVELTAKADDLSLEVEGFGHVRFRALDEIAAMASAGDVPGARTAAATLAPFWDSALGGQAPEGRGRIFGPALRAADAVTDAQIAAMLLHPFRIEDRTTSPWTRSGGAAEARASGPGRVLDRKWRKKAGMTQARGRRGHGGIPAARLGDRKWLGCGTRNPGGLHSRPRWRTQGNR